MPDMLRHTTSSTITHARSAVSVSAIGVPPPPRAHAGILLDRRRLEPITRWLTFRDAQAMIDLTTPLAWTRLVPGVNRPRICKFSMFRLKRRLSPSARRGC